MGWNNPAMRWKELERRLSGLPGADDAPVSRRKRASTEARSISCASASLMAFLKDSFLAIGLSPQGSV